MAPTSKRLPLDPLILCRTPWQAPLRHAAKCSRFEFRLIIARKSGIISVDMPANWLRSFIAGLLLLLPAVGTTGLAGDAMAQGDPLVGKLLIASPSQSEAIFAHTVILVVEHNEA